MTNFVSHSSSIGRIWIHLAFKVKYCHGIFDFPEIKARCEELLREKFAQLRIEFTELGIDRDHTHFIMDIALHCLTEIVKALKGYTAKNLLHEFPWLKKRYFYGSGLWNPSYYFDSLGSDLSKLSEYVRRQGTPKDQSSLASFLTN
jgi:putative transposase